MTHSTGTLDQANPLPAQGRARRLLVDQTRHVLIGMEDDQTRAFLGSAMRREGHDVDVVENGFLLVQLLADEILGTEGGRPPDLIVAEWRMHGCTGQSLLTGIRELGWRTPVIVLARPGETVDAQRTRCLGSIHILERPIDIVELRDLTRVILANATCDQPNDVLPTTAWHPTAAAFYCTKPTGPRFGPMALPHTQRTPAVPLPTCASCGSRSNLRDYGNHEGVAFCRQCSTPLSALLFPEYYCDIGGGG